jgi:hypothetical protein
MPRNEISNNKSERPDKEKAKTRSLDNSDLLIEMRIALSRA